MDAPVMYIVRFWVAPTGHEEVFAWLDGAHGAEVLSQPGFLFIKRVKLEQKSDDGWAAYCVLYGLESREALDNYFANKPLHDKFAMERAPFMRHLRMDRSWGTVESAMDR